jgi:hypothetical protein
MPVQGSEPHAYEQHQRDERYLEGSGDLRHLPLLRHLCPKVERRKNPWTALSGQRGFQPYNEVSVPLYVDVVAFALGPAQVAMSAASITQPVPAATERQLLALLLARAKAHPL